MSDVKIFASIVDVTTKMQVMELADSDAYRDCTIRVMPDCHAGKGCTIGSVIAFNKRVVPNTVGVDIGCGMLVVRLGKADIDLAVLDGIINRYVPAGMKAHEMPVEKFDYNHINATLVNKEYLDCSIGTLGGGNHFIELDIDDYGCKYLVIHSGSRNLGVQVCNYWQEKAVSNLTDDSGIRRELIARLKAEGRQKDIETEIRKIQKPSINRELAYLEGEDLKKYINDMKICQRYAHFNRNIIADIILSHLGITCEGRFTTMHNYIDISRGVIRKGAVSAENGETIIIPMNMRDGSLICRGKGNEDWLCSAPHGAGRIMSRAEAIRSVNIDDFRKSMDGIYSTSVCKETIDESPMVYKPYKNIIEDIRDTVDIISIIRPLYNFKAKTQEKRW